MQPVSGLGDQASAYLAGPGSPPLIILTADSGNAEITVSLLRTGHVARAVQLAEMTATARGVLGALPRSR